MGKGHRFILKHLGEVSKECNILEWAFPNEVTPSVIQDNSITAELSDINITSLIATFTLSEGATAEILGVPCLSGQTEKDYSVPLTIRVIAADKETYKDYIVNVSVINGSEALIYTWEPEQVVKPAVIDQEAKTIEVFVDMYNRESAPTDLRITEFTISEGATIKHNNISIISKVSKIDYAEGLNPTVTVISADGSTTNVYTIKSIQVCPILQFGHLYYTEHQAGPGLAHFYPRLGIQDSSNKNRNVRIRILLDEEVYRDSGVVNMKDVLNPLFDLPQTKVERFDFAKNPHTITAELTVLSAPNNFTEVQIMNTAGNNELSDMVIPLNIPTTIYRVTVNETWWGGKIAAISASTEVQPAVINHKDWTIHMKVKGRTCANTVLNYTLSTPNSKLRRYHGNDFANGSTIQLYEGNFPFEVYGQGATDFPMYVLAVSCTPFLDFPYIRCEYNRPRFLHVANQKHAGELLVRRKIIIDGAVVQTLDYKTSTNSSPYFDLAPHWEQGEVHAVVVEYTILDAKGETEIEVFTTTGYKNVGLNEPFIIVDKKITVS